MPTEIVDIKCPLCDDSHPYLLGVERSPYLFGHTENVRRIRRYFTCPVKNEAFESTLELAENEGGTIVNVNVIGLAREDGNG
jgi:hypothetical protein